MKLRPLHDKVLVKRTEEEETTAGGIVLPGSAAEKPSQGEVIAVGPGKHTITGEFIKTISSVGRIIFFDTKSIFLKSIKLPPQ